MNFSSVIFEDSRKKIMFYFVLFGSYLGNKLKNIFMKMFKIYMLFKAFSECPNSVINTYFLAFNITG